LFHVPNAWRVRKGVMASSELNGNNGAFVVVIPTTGIFNVIASDGEGWEHVSVSLPTRCPEWDEMCLIKDIFWDPEDCVVQCHPPRDEYVNKHPNCLHMWRPTTAILPRPPTWMVG